MDNPRTLEELCDHIVEYADNIYVRAEIDGNWGPHALSELPAKLAIAEALRFIKKRLASDAEVSARARNEAADRSRNPDQAPTKQE